ncbi:MAG: hypothetical protein U7123_07785 [Potamolinea sp.]
MKSKLIALLLVGTMTGLAACDGGSKETTPAGGASPATEAPTGTKSPASSDTTSRPKRNYKSTESSPGPNLLKMRLRVRQNLQRLHLKSLLNRLLANLGTSTTVFSS